MNYISLRLARKILEREKVFVPLTGKVPSHQHVAYTIRKAIDNKVIPHTEVAHVGGSEIVFTEEQLLKAYNMPDAFVKTGRKPLHECYRESENCYGRRVLLKSGKWSCQEHIRG